MNLSEYVDNGWGFPDDQTAIAVPATVFRQNIYIYILRGNGASSTQMTCIREAGTRHVVSVGGAVDQGIRFLPAT